MTKQAFLLRLLVGGIFVIATLGSILIGVAVFLIAARKTSNLTASKVLSAIALFLSAGGVLWLITGSVQAALIYALVVLAGSSLLAWLRVFRPKHGPYPIPTARSDTGYWNLPDSGQDAGRIAYTHFPAAGLRREEAVVYLHGGPATPTRASSYAFYSQLTQDGYDVYLYDQRGSGLSDHLSDISGYTVARHVADLEAIRQHLGVDRLILAGTSWGAVLAMHYAAAHPNHVARAILLSPGVLGPRKGLRYDYARTASSDNELLVAPPLRMVFAGLLARLNPLIAQQFASQRELGAVFDGFVSGPTLEYQVNCKGYKPGAEAASRGGGGNYYANLMTLESLKRTPDPRPELQGHPMPALILRGECDYIPWMSTYSYKQTLPNATLLVVPQAGHALTNVQPELVLLAIRAFLKNEPLPLKPVD